MRWIDHDKLIKSFKFDVYMYKLVFTFDYCSGLQKKIDISTENYIGGVDFSATKLQAIASF